MNITTKQLLSLALINITSFTVTYSLPLNLQHTLVTLTAYLLCGGTLVWLSYNATKIFLRYARSIWIPETFDGKKEVNDFQILLIRFSTSLTLTLLLMASMHA